MTHAKPLAQYMQEVAQRVEMELDRLLPSGQTQPGIIHEAMRYSACNGGKRLRAMLTLEAAGLLHGNGEAALPLAAAIEMIHAYSLIHDDLPCMDDDDYRRGKPTNHKVFGEGIAVLAGDALLTQAFVVIGRLPELTGISAALTVQVLAEVATAIGSTGLVGGQVADLQAEGADPGDNAFAMLQYIHTHKTGALFRCSLRTGGLLGGLTPAQLVAVDEYAEQFGLAFQITDDVLDQIGSAEALGKAVGSDDRSRKLTYPRIFGLARSQQMAREAVEKAQTALEPFGSHAARLIELAQFIVERDH
ncbi:MAG TPA: polyprenyl synthetase family protein [Firmicutes bacterium]|jgi:geranylgeranyl diphosphate synthase type II|nr:polyprenyl synthetase family protein [Bacillota bacterium]